MAYNYYSGNGSHARRIEDAERPPASRPPGVPGGQAPKREKGLAQTLTSLLPDKFGELETEDFILLLILYLMYRESGDSELLMIMGAMFLL